MGEYFFGFKRMEMIGSCCWASKKAVSSKEAEKGIVCNNSGGILNAN